MPVLILSVAVPSRFTLRSRDNEVTYCSASTVAVTAGLLILAPTAATSSIRGGLLRLDAPLVAAALSLLFTLSTLYLAANTNPGVVSREMAAPEEAPSAAPAGYCTACCVQRRPRTHHCRHMRACVDRWDHYCVYIGNAVGSGNHRVFVCFILAATAHAALLTWCAALELLGRAQPWRLASATHALAPALLLLYTAPMGAVLACFSAYHLFLISVNQTSYEYAFKKAYTARANPHDRGCLGNWVGFCGGAPSVAAGEAPDVAHILI